MGSDDCGHDYFVAYSCKRRGVCPSCHTRRTVETAAHHLTDHVLPRLPVRRWVLSVPKRLRYFMHRAGAVLNPAAGIDETAVAQVQADLRRRILRAFVGRDLIEDVDAKEMLAYKHSGFSVDAGVCIEAHDRAGLKQLLRYCARPPFAMDSGARLPVKLWCATKPAYDSDSWQKPSKKVLITSEPSPCHWIKSPPETAYRTSSM